MDEHQWHVTVELLEMPRYKTEGCGSDADVVV
jgi:hypothetical protein